MKTKIYSLFAISALSVSAWSQGVGVNETGNNPNPSAILDVESTDKGFLPPRMTTAQRNAIASPAQGLTIFNSSTNCLQWFSGQTWYDGCTGQETWPPSYVHCNPNNPTLVVEVTSATGRVWMDRNLGANRAAISSTDNQALGSLFQWGRRADGHQCVNRYSGDGITTSSLTALNATVATDTPPHADFILRDTGTNDWRSPKNDNLWQGINGINNPCPVGFRLPTYAEWLEERNSWGVQNYNGAFNSPLKLTRTGERSRINGTLQFFTSGAYDEGKYHASNVDGDFSNHFTIWNTGAGVGAFFRSQGYAVRCIKN